MNMGQSYHLNLPPLRRKIAQRFFMVIGLYALFGILMIIGVFLTSRLTPKLIHVNYDSIAYARHMQVALNSIRYPKSAFSGNIESWTQDFEKALISEEANITEPGEKEVTHRIRSLWEEAKKNLNNIPRPTAEELNQQLDHLISVNEKGMFNIAQQSSSLSQKVYIVGIVFLFITVLLSIIISDGIANKLALPLKKTAEVLRSRPSFGGKLRLPSPSSLEMRILNHELTQLWNRLKYLNEINVEKVSVQSNQLSTILTFVEDAILVLDNDGRVLHCNPGFSDLLGIPQANIIGGNWSDLSTTSDNYFFVRDILSTPFQQHHMVEISKNGQKRALSIRSKIIENDKKQSIGTLYLLHDVTERRQTEKLKREFIGVLSHELKTPLQSLSICADVLSKYKTVLDKDGQLLVDTINEDVSRIRAVATDFMQVGVEDLRSLQLKFEKVNLEETLPEWLKPFVVLANDRKISVNFSFKNDLNKHISARIDKVKFPWVVSNLLANAIRISPPSSEIRVNLQETPQNILIEIADQGPGISPEVQRRMFEPYFQGAVLDGVSSGFLGIGLTIAKEVVEAHNGSIRYEDNKPHGAKFIVSLPKAFSLEEPLT